ncbi:uncharacterized protein AMSG_00762 [Thecamonas trahens ATCC 50062]|uniref:U2A'/phosphoprotein 32 family A C-terminal domain-containing protein n=1 Tax=Thecamonas trahens ATCC 50062 TaxID=461836 RepID=A0A0L0DH22_THETB|nr:hypothetical protein AMSG_00762 [Thecamonas trahens ATCC 50062]KNC50603.1 hypothetical protein AMSG_00762 [Thecamonas trahens ATCC 50062]|eukprot:XP_013762490.1 hypothetical protein AMSG_00762 [Thecamonas trahens ATCC 50062]
MADDGAPELSLGEALAQQSAGFDVATGKISVVGKFVTSVGGRLPAGAAQAETLFLSSNSIATAAPLARFQNARVISLANNLVSSFDDVAALAALPSLSVLSLEGNPIVELPLYRPRLLLLLPRLRMLDGVETSASERKAAEAAVAAFETTWDLLLGNAASVARLEASRAKAEMHLELAARGGQQLGPGFETDKVLALTGGDAREGLSIEQAEALEAGVMEAALALRDDRPGLSWGDAFDALLLQQQTRIRSLLAELDQVASETKAVAATASTSSTSLVEEAVAAAAEAEAELRRERELVISEFVATARAAEVDAPPQAPRRKLQTSGTLPAAPSEGKKRKLRRPKPTKITRHKRRVVPRNSKPRPEPEPQEAAPAGPPPQEPSAAEAEALVAEVGLLRDRLRSQDNQLAQLQDVLDDVEERYASELADARSTIRELEGLVASGDESAKRHADGVDELLRLLSSAQSKRVSDVLPDAIRILGGGYALASPATPDASCATGVEAATQTAGFAAITEAELDAMMGELERVREEHATAVANEQTARSKTREELAALQVKLDKAVEGAAAQAARAQLEMDALRCRHAEEMEAVQAAVADQVAAAIVQTELQQERGEEAVLHLVEKRVCRQAFATWKARTAQSMREAACASQVELRARRRVLTSRWRTWDHEMALRQAERSVVVMRTLRAGSKCLAHWRQRTAARVEARFVAADIDSTDDVRAALEATQVELKRMRVALEEAKAEGKAEAERVRVALEVETSRVRAALEEADAEVSQLRAALEAATAEAETARAGLAAAEISLAETLSVKSDGKDAGSELDEAVVLRSQLEKALAAHAQTEAELAVVRASLEEAETDAASVRASLADAEAARIEAESRLAVASARVDEKAALVEALQSQCRASKELAASAEADAQSWQAEAAVLRESAHEAARLEAVVAELQSTVERMESEARVMSTELERSRGLEAEVAELQSQVVELETGATKLTRSHDDDGALSELRSQLDDLVSSNRVIETAAEEQVAALEAKVEELRAELQQAGADVDGNRAALDQAEAEAVAGRATIERLQVLLEVREADVQRLQRELEQAGSESDSRVESRLADVEVLLRERREDEARLAAQLVARENELAAASRTSNAGDAAQLAASVAQLERELRDREVQIHKLELVAAVRESDLARAQERVEDLPRVAELERVVGLERGHVKSLKEELATRESDVRRLEKECTEMQTRAAVAKAVSGSTDNRASEDRIAKLEHELVVRDADLRTREDEVAALRTKVAVAEAIAGLGDDASDRIARLEHTLVVRDADLRARDEELADLRLMLAEADAPPCFDRSVEVDDRVAKLEHELVVREGDLRAREDEVVGLRSQLAVAEAVSATTDNAAFESRIAMLEQQLASYRGDLRAREDEIVVLRAQASSEAAPSKSTDVAVYESRIAMLEQQITAREGDLRAREDEVVGLRSQLAVAEAVSATTDNAAFESRIAMLEQQLASCRGDLRAREDEVVVLRAQASSEAAPSKSTDVAVYESRIAMLEQQITAREGDLRAREDEVVGLRSQLAVAEAVSATTDNAAFESRIAMLEQQLASCRGDLRAREDEVVVLRAQASSEAAPSKSTDVAASSEAAPSKSTDVAVYESRIAMLEQQITAREGDLRAREDEVVGLRSQLAVAEAVSATTDNAAFESRIAMLEQQLASCRGDLRAREDEVVVLRAQASSEAAPSKSTDVAVYESRIAMLEQQITAREGDLRAREDEVVGLRSQLAVAEAVSATTDNAAFESRIAMLEQQLASCRGDLRGREDEVVGLRAQASSEAAQNKSTDVAVYESRIAMLEQQLASCRVVLKKRLAEQEAEGRDRDAELALLHEQLDAEVSESSVLRDRIATLEAELANQDDDILGLRAHVVHGDGEREESTGMDELETWKSRVAELEVLLSENDAPEASAQHVCAFQERVSELEAELEIRDADLGKYKADLEMTNVQLATALDTSALNDRITELEADLDARETELRRREDEVVELMAKIAAAALAESALERVPKLEAMLAMREEDLAAARNEQKELVTELEKRSSAYGVELKQLNAEIDDLSGLLAEAEAEAAAATDISQQCAEENTRLKAEIEDLAFQSASGQHAACTAEIERLHARISVLEGEASIRMHEAAALDTGADVKQIFVGDKATQLATHATLADPQLAELKAQLAAADDRVAELETKLAAASARVAELETKLAAASARVAELETKLAAADAEATKSEAERMAAATAPADSRSPELETKLAAASARVAELETKLAAADAQATKSEAECMAAATAPADSRSPELETKLAAASARVAELETKLAAADAQATKSEAECMAAATAPADSRSPELETKLAAASARVTELEAELEMLSDAETGRPTHSSRDAHAALAMASSTSASHLDRILALKEKLDAKDALIAALRAALTREARTKPLWDRISALESQLATRESELAATAADLARARLCMTAAPQAAAALATVDDDEALKPLWDRIAALEAQLDASRVELSQAAAALARTPLPALAPAVPAPIRDETGPLWTRIADLEAQLDEARAAERSKDVQLAESEAALAAARGEATRAKAADALAADLRGLRSVLRTKDAIISRLRDQLAAQPSTSASDAAASAAADEVAALHAELVSVRARAEQELVLASQQAALDVEAAARQGARIAADKTAEVDVLTRRISVLNARLNAPSLVIQPLREALARRIYLSKLFRKWAASASAAAADRIRAKDKAFFAWRLVVAGKRLAALREDAATALAGARTRNLALGMWVHWWGRTRDALADSSRPQRPARPSRSVQALMLERDAAKAELTALRAEKASVRARARNPAPPPVDDRLAAAFDIAASLRKLLADKDAELVYTKRLLASERAESSNAAAQLQIRVSELELELRHIRQPLAPLAPEPNIPAAAAQATQPPQDAPSTKPDASAEALRQSLARHVLDLEAQVASFSDAASRSR